MTDFTAISPRSPKGQLGPDPNLKSYACLTCRQRKIKCDRNNPCSNCVKATRQCSFIPPIRGKRKRTKTPKEGLHIKLRRYEELLKSYGAKVEPSEYDDDSDSEIVGRLSQPDVDMAEEEHVNVRGRTNAGSFDRGESSRDFESHPASSSEEEFLYPGEAHIAGPKYESNVKDSLSALFIGSPELTPNGQSETKIPAFLQLPSPVLLKLWDVYVDRVDPLVKILHLPTFRSTLTVAIQHPQDVSKSLRALVCVFYLVTIASLAEDECLDLLGGQKSGLFARQECAARRALRTAGFLESSSLVTLQAFAIYLIGARGSYRNDTLYTLSGVAVRLARKMSLHRDGTSSGHSPFETEMRRRLWWHVAHVDYRMSDLVGAQPSMDIFSGDAKTPLNITDEDISPDMVDLPLERKGITCMAISLMRCDSRELLCKFLTPIRDSVNGWEIAPNPDITTTEKENMINQLEALWEERYLRYCDPSNTLHQLVSIMVRSGISLFRIKLYSHDPRRFADRGIQVPESERDIIFTNATKILEYVNLVRGNRSLDKYLWQIGTSFLWNPYLYVLIEARHRKIGPEIDRLWQLIGSVLLKYPQMFEKSTGAVYAALGKWTLEAWDGYLAATKVEGLAEPSTPEYINAIRRSRLPLVEPLSNQIDLTRSEPVTANLAGNSTGHDKNLHSDPDPVDFYDFSDLLSFETDLDQWVQWESVVAGERIAEGDF